MIKNDNRRVFVVINGEAATPDFLRGVASSLSTKALPAAVFSVTKKILYKAVNLPHDIEQPLQEARSFSNYEAQKILRILEDRTGKYFVGIPSHYITQVPHKNVKEMSEWLAGFVAEKFGNDTLLDLVLNSEPVSSSKGAIVLANLESGLLETVQKRFVNTFVFSSDSSNPEEVALKVMGETEQRMPGINLL